VVRRILDATLSQARRLIVIVIGFTVLFLGIAFIVLPGPAIIVIPAGLAILATEFVWARILLRKIREKTEGVASTVNPRRWWRRR
jgi:uncharacterized protein (TIGR02611 family)